jgi:hypothetical protein
MPTDNHYAARRREVCEWCAKGLRLSKEPGGSRTVHIIAVEYDSAGDTIEYEYCVAPTIEQFAESQARIADIRGQKLEHAGEALRKRREQVRELEHDKAAIAVTLSFLRSRIFGLRHQACLDEMPELSEELTALLAVIEPAEHLNG